jgi:HSP20 family protein
MTEAVTKNRDTAATPSQWRPFESLRREVDRLFEDFDKDAWQEPFRRSMSRFEPFWRQGAASGLAVPAVDIVEKGDAYEVEAELPGMDEKDIDVKVVGGSLTITGEKKSRTEEKKQNYHLSERRYGSFVRSFPLPGGVDANAIAATFKKGVLTVTMPKTAEAKKPEKRISVKAD